MEDKLASKQALKASGLVGGGQVLNIIIGLVRTKVIAILLGPSGVGLVGILTNITDLIRGITSFGLPFSGVRDISIAEAADNKEDSIKIISVFLKWILISAFIGMIITIILAVPINSFVFGNNEDHSAEIVFLSIAIFFGALNAGLGTVIQGKRVITLLVKASIVSNVCGSGLMIITYYLLNEKGIVPAIIIGSFCNLICTFFFFRKLNIKNYENVKILESWRIAKSMIKIGFFTIIVSSVDQLMSLGLRAFVNQQIGATGVGIFTASISIATTYLSMVLTTMASDYYPKLASIHTDNLKLNVAFNSQLEIVLLLSAPLIIGMIGYSGVVIELLYTPEFLEGRKILEWQILGDFIKIISWALGYVILAKGLGSVYVYSNVFYNILYTAIVILCWPFLELLGVGISFFVSHCILLIFCCVYCYKKFSIKINTHNVKIIFIQGFLVALSFIISNFIEIGFKYIISGLFLMTSFVVSYFYLNKIINLGKLINNIRKKIKK